MIYGEVETLIKHSLAGLSLSSDGIAVERPEVPEHGDFATNAALVCGKQVGENPRELAEKLKGEIESRGGSLVERAEVAGPGFINLFLRPEVYTRAVRTILEKKEKYGWNDMLNGKKIMVEYTQPNPFKPLHIGHLMSNAIGESVSRITQANGADVIRANYQGDIGLHVAKAIWALQKKDLDPGNIKELGDAYVYGNEMYENDKTAQEEIIEINKHIYAQDDENINEIYKKGREASLAHFEDLYKKLGTQFDRYYFESETAPIGQALVKENTGKVFKESDGAIIFPGEDFGLHSRVFITRDGLPTYEAKDLGLAKVKIDEYAPDISITITAVEQKEYFNVVFKALTEISPEYEGVFQHIAHGMMQLPEGKMSSRKGNVVTGESLIEEAEERARARMEDKELQNDERLVTAIGISALKYAVLKQSIGKNISFDMDAALSFEGDSGPYLQYTHARIKSILRKREVEPSLETAENPEELERLLAAFPEAVRRAYTERAPNKITTHLIDVAQSFNAYYAEKRIADNPYRLALAQATATVLENGLYLLGISAPEQM